MVEFELPKKKSVKAQNTRTEILDYHHKGVKRKNNPEEGLAIYLPEEKASQKYSYDPHLDPQLVWSGKAERTSFEVPVVPLHIHERVSPRSIVGTLEKKRSHQLRLFDEAEFPLDKRVDFYKHDMDWANRLILGDSLLVMNSLLTKELMTGKVQMIYIDPPYGISYNSNFQSQLGQTTVRDGDDSFLTREPEQIKAYRDTWELGVHSYLAYIQDRLMLSRELLSETGSIFVQINDENLHHVKEILDEVFGLQNFCSVICLQKTGGKGSKLLSNVFDFILWYAKNKETVKYHELFMDKELGGEGSAKYEYIELEDGTRRRATAREKVDRHALPKKSRVFRLDNMTSQSGSVVELEFQGKRYQGKWKTNMEGFKRLVEANRIVASENTLNYVRYLDDFAAYPLTNYWPLGGIQSRSDPKVYVVQTATSAIQNCILMATDPGDLVFDPTCGSGTTAFVAEQWGRRWITCDTSRVAVAIARQRLMTAIYPYYVLSQPMEGVRSGFKCKTIPHVMLRTIAQNEFAETEIFYDQPQIDKSAVRVSGPFTVEAIPAPSVETLERERKEGIGYEIGQYVSTLIEAIRKSGVIFPQGKKLGLQSVVPISSAGFLHAEGLSVNGENRKVVISFGPRYGPLSARQTEEAIRAATVAGYQLLILAGFQIDPAAEAFVQRTAVKLDVQFAHINPDMEIHDLLKQTQGSQLFSVFGEPDIELKQVGQVETYVAKLLGVDVYDPVTGNTEQTSGDAIPAWFLDEDYDGYSFNICQAFFPDGATGKNPWDKLENALHGIIDKEKVEQLKSNESLPFESGEHKTIAVKVFDNRGNEVIKIRKLQGPRKV